MRNSMHEMQLQLFNQRKLGEEAGTACSMSLRPYQHECICARKDEAQKMLKKMKDAAEKADAEMSDWFDKRYAKYKEDSSHRLAVLEDIKSEKRFGDPLQDPLPPKYLQMRQGLLKEKYEEENEATDLLIATAQWLRSGFKAQLIKICDELNRLESASKLGFELPKVSEDNWQSLLDVYGAYRCV